MVNYKCPRCGYEINIKTKYMNHLRRKNLCKATISNSDLQNEYIKYGINDKIVSSVNYCKNHNISTQVSQKSVKSHSKVSQNSLKSHSELSQNSNNENKLFECQFCNKCYVHKQSLHKHLKICNEKQKDEEAKESINELVGLLNKQLQDQKEQNNELKVQLKKRDKQIDELIKKAGMTIGTQNIQQNIKILAYNNTDISHLTDKDYLKCLKHSNFCIPHLIEQIHFNPQKPENHNIYISNLKNNYVMIYNGNKWMLNDREESIQNLIDDKESMIEQKLEEWVENGKQYPDIMRKFNRYLEKKENDKVINKVKDEIKLMLFNNRDVVSL